jgi:hypothetical protein
MPASDSAPSEARKQGSGGGSPRKYSNRLSLTDPPHTASWARQIKKQIGSKKLDQKIDLLQQKLSEQLQ